MKQFITQENGTLRGEIDGVEVVGISEGHPLMVRVNAEVEAGEAEILPYVKPPQTPEQIRDEALAALVLDFSDGRVIQCRPADEQALRNEIERMQRLGIADRDWYMADNTKHRVTLSELQQTFEYGQDQAALIWDDFFAAIGG